MISEEKSADKIERVLSIYTKLLNGHIVNKAEEALNCAPSQGQLT